MKNCFKISLALSITLFTHSNIYSKSSELLEYGKEAYHVSEISRGLKEVQVASVNQPKLSKKISNKKNKKQRSNKEFDEVLFAQSDIVDDESLGQIRGGFVTSNGMVIDIGIVRETYVGGNIVDQVSYSSKGVAAKDFSGYQRHVQINEIGESSVSGLDSTDLPSFVTVIQNSANNIAIQNLNVIDLEVSNVQAFKHQGLVPVLNANISYFGK